MPYVTKKDWDEIQEKLKNTGASESMPRRMSRLSAMNSVRFLTLRAVKGEVLSSFEIGSIG